MNYDADFLAAKLKNKSAPPEAQMKLKVRHAAIGDVWVEMSNLLPINEFKQLYIDTIKDK